MKPLRLTALCLILLTGCKLGPDYKRPAVDVGAQFRGDVTTTTASIADLPWWEVFKDPQLQEYIGIALENNKDLQIAVWRVAEARAVVGIVRADFFPQINGYGTGSRTRLSDRTNQGLGTVAGTLTSPAGVSTFAVEGPEVDKYVNLYQSGIDLAYEIDLWGRIRRSSESARALLLATEDARRTITSALVADVARNYFQLRELDLELEIATRTLESRRESQRLIKLRLDYGRANGLDYERAAGETAATAATMARIEYAIAQTENVLSILLGRNPGDLNRGRALIDQPAMPNVPPGLPSDLIERRPDVMAAEQLLVAANAQIGVAKALFFPRISLTGFAGFESDALNDWFTHDAHTWSIAGNLAQPIFNGGRLWFGYKGVKARREAALIAYLGSIQQALAEVADALAARKYSYQEREERQKQVDALVRASALANQRYEGGRSDYLDVLDAEREQFSAELQLAQARLSELVSVIQLYRALGGGWQAPEQQLAQSAAGTKAE